MSSIVVIVAVKVEHLIGERVLCERRATRDVFAVVRGRSD